jgi:hypothetical protein
MQVKSKIERFSAGKSPLAGQMISGFSLGCQDAAVARQNGRLDLDEWLQWLDILTRNPHPNRLRWRPPRDSGHCNARECPR